MPRDLISNTHEWINETPNLSPAHENAQNCQINYKRYNWDTFRISRIYFYTLHNAIEYRI